MSFSWKNGAGGSWETPANWGLVTTYPTGDVSVTIAAAPIGGSYAVTLDVGITLASFSMIAAATLLTDAGLTIDGGGSAGTIEANGGALTLGGAFVNTGLITSTAGFALSGSTLTLFQAGTAAVGTIEASGGASTLVNTDIQGGVVLSTGTASFGIGFDTGATLDGSAAPLTLTGTLNVGNDADLTLLGAINLTNGVVQTGAANYSSNIVIDGNVTLSGGGQIELGNGSTNNLTGENNGTLDTLINVNATIGGGGSIGGGTLALTNEAAGVINANGGSSELLVYGLAGTLANQGLIEATNTAGLELRGVSIDNTVTNSGGTIGNAGTILAKGGSVSLTGGTVVRGGTLATAGGNVIRVTFSQTATLDGTATGAAASHATANVTGVIDVDNDGVLALKGTVAGGGTISLDAANYGSYLVVTQVGGTQVVLAGKEQIQLAGDANDTIEGAVGTDQIVLLSATVSGVGTVEGLTLINKATGVVNANSAAGSLVINTGSNASSNAGLLEATAAGGLYINGSTIANTGTVLSTGMGVVHLDNSTITGGAVAGLGGGVVVDFGFQNSTLDGSAAAVTVTGVVTATNDAALTLIGSIVNDGTLLAKAANYQAFLLVSGAATTLSGGGQVQLADTGNNGNPVLEGALAADVLVNVNNTISGGGRIGNGQMGIDNQAGGIIDATGTANALTISTGAAGMTNEGLVEATSPTVLVIAATTIGNTGTIEANGIGTQVDLTGGTDIKGGMLATPVQTVGSVTGNGVIQVSTGNGATLDGSVGGVTITGTFEVDNNAYVSLLGTIVNDGSIVLAATNYSAQMYAASPSVTLTGGGRIVLSDDPNNLIQSDNVTVDSTVTVFGYVNVNNTISGAGALGGGQLDFDNQKAGVIDATGGNALVINVGTGSTFTNEGLLEATNPGGLTAEAGLLVVASTIDNLGSGNAGVLWANGNAIHLQANADIEGGTLKTANGGVIVVDFDNSATADGSTSVVNNTGTLEAANDAALYALGTIVNTGSILIAANNYLSYLVVDAASLTLTGSGQVVMADSGNGVIEGAAGADKLVNVNNTISGSGRLGNGQMALDNQAKGVIDATGTAAQLVLSLTSFTNEGLVEATGPAGLVIAGTTVTNAGTIEANGIGTTVDLIGGTDIKGGVLATPMQTVGSVTGSGVVQTTFDSSATLDGSGGGITNLGTISAFNDSVLNLLGTITNDGTLVVAASNYGTRLAIDAAAVTLTGGGQVQMADIGNSIIVGAAAKDKLINVNNTISGSGQFGDGSLSVTNEAAGVIDANGVSAALTIDTAGGSFSNAGLIEATAIQASGADELTIYATTISNTGSILAAGAGTHIGLTAKAEIIGGTVGGTGGGYIEVDSANYATLDALTVVGTAEAANNSVLDLVGVISNTGLLWVAASNYGTVLQIDSATVNLRGGGQVLLADTGNSIVNGANATDKLINVNNTISGSGQLGGGGLSVDNQATGLIDATGSAAGMTINVGAGTFTNEGKIEDTGTAGLTIQSAIGNTGSILAVGAAASITLDSGSDIAGGTFGSTGGGVAVVAFDNAATLDGTNTITLVGTVQDGNDASLFLLGSVVNKGTLVVAASNYSTVLYAASPVVTLGGGGSVVMNDSTGSIIESATTADLLVNVNNTISGSGQLGGGQLNIDNEAAGVINANGNLAGMNINVGTGTFTNQGLIETTGTEGLSIYSAIANAGGTIVAAGAGTVINLYTGDDIVGGTFGSTGGGVAAVAFDNTGTLDGTNAITTIGTVEAGNDAALDLIGTVNNLGTLVVGASNYASEIIIAGPTVTLTGGGSLEMNDTNNSIVEGAATGDLLVNVNNTIFGAGRLGNNSLNISNKAAGIIDGSGGNQLVITVGTIGNSGLIEATGAGGVLMSEVELSNFGHAGTVATITGGSYAGINSTLTLSGTGFATLVDSASLTLSGTGQITIGGTAIDTMLTTITGAGLLAVLGGRNFAATHAIGIASGGVLRLGGGTFSTSVGGITSAGLIAGFGSIATTGVVALTSTGTIEASGGLLKLGTLSGVGALQVDGGSTLEVPNATTDTVTYNGANATLRLDVPASYTGTIDGLAPGSILDLAGTKISGAKFSGNSLVVTKQGGGTLTYALGSLPAAGDLIKAANGGGDGFVTIYGLAQPGTIAPSPISFGNVLAGATVTQGMTLGNTAPNNGFYENLDATISGTGSGITAAGTLSGLGAQQSNGSALTVTLNSKTDGVMTCTVVITETSDGTGIDGLPVTVFTPETITATGTVYALAAPKLSATSLKFAAERVGGAGQAMHLLLSNGTTADPFQESLKFVETPPTGVVGATGATGGTIVAGGSVALGFTLNASTSGSFLQTPVTVALTSLSGGAGLGNTVLAAGTIKITGQVFQTAAASFGTVVDFGIVHVGDTVEQNLSVSNTATGALVDALIGSVAAITGGAQVTASGSLNVASLGTGELGFTLDTGTAGAVGGTATVDLASHDSVLADATLSPGTVTLTGTIDNYATAELLPASGAGIAAFGGPDVETLTVATVQGTAATATLSVGNDATGPADLLTGTLAVGGPGTAGFANTLPGFSDYAAQQVQTTDTVSLTGAATGYAIEQIVLSATGSNASSYSAAVASKTLDVLGGVGNAVLTAGTNTVTTPTGSTIVTMGGGLNSGDSINGGAGGGSTLLLLGAGNFDLSAPTALTHIGTVTAMEGQAAFTPTGGITIPNASQTVTLRNGLSVTLNVTAAPAVLINPANPNPTTITIHGANDASVINLGAGADTVYLGAATETVNGGTGSGSVYGTAATAGAHLDGAVGGGPVTLEIDGGGTAKLNAADTNLTVTLSAATNLTLGSMAFVSAIADTSGSTISAKGTGQTLGSVAGGATLNGFSGFGDTFMGTSAGMSGDTIAGFGGTGALMDGIDLTDLAPTATLKYSGNANKGTLSLSDGTHSASISLTGNFTQSNFVIGTDNHGGSLITYA